MGADSLTTRSELVRRLALTRQGLAGPRPRRASGDGITDRIREVGYIQWDPIAVVAPSHLLSLWARVGQFAPSLLERLLFREKRLFEHWTPAASLVLTEDYPLFASLMERYPQSMSHSWGNQRTRARKFLAAHGDLRRQILRSLARGPRTLGEFADHRTARRQASDWQPASAVAEMVYHLCMQGQVMVVGRVGNQNRWGLTSEFLPADVDRRALGEAEFERTAARRALHALGTATPAELTYYFPRGRYETLDQTLRALVAEGTVTRVVVEDLPGREERYTLTEDRAILEAMAGPAWRPRTSLIPPFDNLIYSTARADRLFGFHYVREQFLPAAKRRYGFYVLPIVHGDRLIGRIDPRLDRATSTLVVHGVFAEPTAPDDRSVGESVGRAVAELAMWVGARQVRYTRRVPGAWKHALASASPDAAS